MGSLTFDIPFDLELVQKFFDEPSATYESLLQLWLYRITLTDPAMQPTPESEEYIQGKLTANDITLDYTNFSPLDFVTVYNRFFANKPRVRWVVDGNNPRMSTIRALFTEYVFTSIPTLKDLVEIKDYLLDVGAVTSPYPTFTSSMYNTIACGLFAIVNVEEVPQSSMRQLMKSLVQESLNFTEGRAVIKFEEYYDVQLTPVCVIRRPFDSNGKVELTYSGFLGKFKIEVKYTVDVSRVYTVSYMNINVKRKLLYQWNSDTCIISASDINKSAYIGSIIDRGTNLEFLWSYEQVSSDEPNPVVYTVLLPKEGLTGDGLTYYDVVTKIFSADPSADSSNSPIYIPSNLPVFIDVVVPEEFKLLKWDMLYTKILPLPSIA